MSDGATTQTTAAPTGAAAPVADAKATGQGQPGRDTTTGRFTATGKPDAGNAAPTAETQGVVTPAVDNKTAQEIRELADGDLDAMVTIKVNGATKKVTVREAIKRAQVSEAAEERLSKAKAESRQNAELRGKLEQLAVLAQKNPEAFLRLVGTDPEEFAEATLQQRLKMLEMSPVERENFELRQKLTQKEQREKEWQEHQEREKSQREEETFAKALDDEMRVALESHAMPKDKFYVQQVAAHMISAEMRGEPLSAKDAAAIVKERFTGQVKAHVKALDVNQLREFLGQDILNRLRESELERMQSQQSAPAKRQGTPPSQSKEKQPKVFKSDADYRAWIESLKTSA